MRYLWLIIVTFVVLGQHDPVAASVAVHSADQLQAAISAARPGDTILLDPGVIYVGHFILPARQQGNDTRVVTIRTGGADLIPEGRRMTPATAAGVAKIRSPDGDAALRTASGARFWSIQLVEFLANQGGAGDVIELGDGSTAQTSLDDVPSDITLDRLYIHGDPESGQKRAVALNSVRTNITNSYIADIKAIGQDSQAICGWNGPGSYLIQNNYLEAAGENVLFGGADPAILGLTPTNIVISGNTVSKPLAWRSAGSPWEVKNLLELKNARGVTIEKNDFERNWLAAQSGFAVLFTGRNQDGGCPWCQVETVTFRQNVVRDVAAGFSILGYDDGFPSGQTNGIVISNNVFDGIDRSWGGNGYFLQMTNRPSNIVVDHNTIILGDSSGIAQIEEYVDGFAFTNNLTPMGQYGIAASGRGLGNDAIHASLPGANVAGNVIAGASAGSYPPGNFFPTLQDFQAQFVDFAGHNFLLKSNSTWLHSATDGTSVGATASTSPVRP